MQELVDATGETSIAPPTNQANNVCLQKKHVLTTKENICRKHKTYCLSVYI